MTHFIIYSAENGTDTLGDDSGFLDCSIEAYMECNDPFSHYYLNKSLYAVSLILADM